MRKQEWGVMVGGEMRRNRWRAGEGMDANGVRRNEILAFEILPS